MADEVEDVKQSPEPVIEPYYQAQAKQLIDTLFDLGLLSESMSRDGIDNVEGLVALYFQQIATSAAKCAGFAKRYKVLGGRLKKDDDDDRKRHEEEMRWIARAKDAESALATLKKDGLRQMVKVCGEAAEWAQNVVAMLREILAPPYCVNAGTAADLLVKADELGITEPDCRPGKDFFTSREFEKYRPGVGLKSNMEEVGPENHCPKCGGRIL